MLRQEYRRHCNVLGGGGGEWVLILILNDNTHHRSLQRVGRMDISVSPVVLQQREISS